MQNARRGPPNVTIKAEEEEVTIKQEEVEVDLSLQRAEEEEEQARYVSCT